MKQPLEHCQARIHHTKPLVVTAQIFPFFANNFTQPLLDMRVVHIIVIHPLLFTSIVRRIDIDAIHSSLIFRQQRFQCNKIIPMNNHVAAMRLRCIRFILGPKPILVFQRIKRHFQMVIHHLIFSYPIQYRHIILLYFYSFIFKTNFIPLLGNKSVYEYMADTFFLKLACQHCIEILFILITHSN